MHKYNSNDGIEYESEDDVEDNVEDNVEDDVEDGMLKMMLKMICISVIVRLVSITPGHVKLDWLPSPKVDRVNDNPAHYQH